MRAAILETVKTSGGFEQEFDRLIINELKKQGHEPVLYLPERSSLPVDFGIPVEYMQGGEIVDYEEAGKLKKLWLSIQREQRRVRWFNSAYEKAVNGEVDVIFLTTATYRYLRSLRKSKLKDSPVPVVFIFLGVNPQEKPKFLAQARACLLYKNIKLKITSLRNDFANDQVQNVEIIPPPVLLPDGIEADSHLIYKEPVRIGFFGHYRKGEKDVEGIIRAFVQTNMGSKAEFVVQAAPTDAKDAEDMQRIMDTYSRETNVTFIKGKLFGKSWYDALQSVNILFLPYSNPRYLYNWSAVYFNALALYKPVLVTPVLNPEILAQYNIGAEVNLQDMDVLSVQLRDFLMSYKENIPMYENNLRKVNSDFSTAAFLKQILK
jgi:hypothetical protein